MRIKMYIKLDARQSLSIARPLIRCSTASDVQSRYDEVYSLQCKHNTKHTIYTCTRNDTSDYFCTRWAKKWDHKLTAIILSYRNRFTNFFTRRFPGKFAAKWLLKIPPLLAYVATLPCETLMFGNKRLTIIQGSVATYSRCCGLLINKLRKVNKGPSLKKFFFKSVNIWQSYMQERGCLMHFMRLATRLLKMKKVHETTTFLLVTLPNIHRFNDRLSNKPVLILLTTLKHLQYVATLPCK